MQILIRTMTDKDIPGVGELLCSCYKWLAEIEGFPKEFTDFLLMNRGSIDTIEKESKIQRYLVACHGTDIVGMVSVKNDEITKLYVNPVRHRQGVGKILFNTAEELIAKDGFDQIILGVLGKSALAFYKSMGMVISGRKQSRLDCYPQGEIVLMKKELKPD
jgi:ribosomal protein S18 acetylase RimI-like enzyme